MLSSGKKLSEEELNALIAHAHRRIEQLQRQLAHQMTMEASRIQQACSMQEVEDEKLCCQRIIAEAQHLKEEFDLTKDKWVSTVFLLHMITMCLGTMFWSTKMISTP